MAPATPDQFKVKELWLIALAPGAPGSAPQPGSYSAVVLAVAHRDFVAMGSERIRAFGKPGAVLFDVKRALPRASVDGCL